MKRNSFERLVQKIRHEDEKVLYQMRDGTLKMPKKCEDVSAKRYRALKDMQTIILMKRQMKRYRKKTVTYSITLIGDNNFYKSAMMLLRFFKLHTHTVHTETIR